jgi:hypothetical protein
MCVLTGDVDFMKLREAAHFTPPAPNTNCPSIISYNTNKTYEDGIIIGNSFAV